MNEINRIRQLAGLSILNEALEGSALQALKNAAKKNSEGGYAQYVNRDSSCNAGYCLSDTPVKDTIAGYKNGKSITESAPPGKEALVKKLKKEYPGEEDKAFATAWAIDNKEKGKSESVNEDESETQTQSTAAVDNADAEFDAAEDGNSEEVVEAYDFHNGYDEVHYADEPFKYPNFGIPTGADGPVVKRTGAAGARHGDNPEQKYMAVTEDIHKELVYKYRDFLKENGTFDLKKKLSEELESALNIKLEEEYGDWRNDSSSITFSGPITVVGTALNKQGDTVSISYSVNITASAKLNWESAESPVGWSVDRDNIDYASAQVASVDDVSVTSAVFTSDDTLLVDDEEYQPSKANTILHRDSIKHIKDAKTYSSVLLPAFANHAESIEQPTDESIW